MKYLIHLQCISMLNLTLLVFISFAKRAAATNYCCDLDDGDCSGWTDGSGSVWQSSLAKKPDTGGITDYQDDNTPNDWLQNGTAVKWSPSFLINENDVISIQFYRHTPSDTSSKVLMVQVLQNTGATLVLIDATKQGWKDYTYTCTNGTVCPKYPCMAQFQVKGIIADSSELLAFDDFTINGCQEITTTSIPTHPTFPRTTEDPNSNVTVETTITMTITTVTTTVYSLSTYDKPITSVQMTTTSTNETKVY